MTLPLAGITVVSLEQAIAAPLASRHLADWGARVVKVERPNGGDFARGYDSVMNGLSSQFLWVNRSKESVVLDLKDEGGRTSLEQLVSEADVFIQNLAPGAAKRLGFDAEQVVQRHPKIVAGDLSGYGSSGPYSQKKAYDLLVQCEVGLTSINGTQDQPAKCGLSVVDIAGGMAIMQGVLMGLLRRARTGQGMRFEASLFDGIAEWMSYPAYYTSGSGSAPARKGLMHATIAPYGPFCTGDGKTIFLGIQNDREWGEFCVHVLHAPELIDDVRFATNGARLMNVDQITDLVEVALQPLSAEEALCMLENAGIANANLNDVVAFLQHPQLLQRDRFVVVDSSYGPQRVIKPAVRIHGCEPVMGPVPALGEHTGAAVTSARNTV